MKPLSHRLYALCAIALAVVLFVAVNIVANQWLGTARLDLTQNGLYTVSPGTEATLSKLPEAVTLRFYFSRKPAAGYAQIVAYAGRVHTFAVGKRAIAPNVKTFGILTCSRLSSGFPLAFVLHSTLE